MNDDACIITLTDVEAQYVLVGLVTATQHYHRTDDDTAAHCLESIAVKVRDQVEHEGCTVGSMR